MATLLLVQGVYGIVNAVNGHRYVGSSKNVAARSATHFRMLRSGAHHSSHLQRAWDVYGASSFMVVLLEVVADAGDLKAREQIYIDATPRCERYNAASDARRGPGMAGQKHSAAALERLRAATATRMADPAERAKCNPMHDAARRLRLRATSAGHVHTPEHKARIGAALKGRKFSAAHRANISAAGKLRAAPSSAARENMRAASRRRIRKPHTVETKAKMSEAAKRRYRKDNATCQLF